MAFYGVIVGWGMIDKKDMTVPLDTAISLKKVNFMHALSTVIFEKLWRLLIVFQNRR